MKKIIFLCTIFALVILSGCSIPNKFSGNIKSSIKTDQSAEHSVNYLDLRNLTPVYDEYEKLSGYLMIGMTDACGSDCSANLLFINNLTDKINIKSIDDFTSSSMGFDIYEKDKNIYISSFIWGDGEGHFGCHKFNVKKVKYINNKFEVIEDKITWKKYAFDLGDARGQCGLFKDVESLIKNEKLFN